MRNNKKVKIGSFLEISGVYFWTFIIAFAIASSLDDGSQHSALRAAAMIVFLPIFTAFSYWINAKYEIIKKIVEKVYDFNGIEPDIKEDMLTDRSDDSEKPGKEDVENVNNSIWQIQEMNLLQQHRIKLQKYRENIIAQKAKLDRESEEREAEINKRESALRKTEFTIIDWISRMEKKEQSVFDEIAKNFEKYK